MRTLPVAIARLVAEPEGSRRLGQFALLRQLGRGGFAPVWSAREEYAGRELRTVALKLFSLEPEDGLLVNSVDQVLEEARTLCRIEHPNVVRFNSVVIDSSRRVAGFAMEHLAGRSLDQSLAEQTFALSEVVEVGVAIASALAAVHRAGIVHRDVKPANIIETAHGYKLIDFGIALGAQDAPPAVNASGVEVLDAPLSAGRSRSATLGARSSSHEQYTLQVEIPVGTIGYIDPECIAHSKAASPAGDLYALGATLFELASGNPPAGWDGRVLRGEVMDGRRAPPPLEELVSGLDPEFSDLVQQLLSPTRAGRPSSAQWVVTKLEQLRHTLAGRHRQLPPEDIGPFRGLARFETDDRAVYFGRSMEIAQALHLLRVRGLVALLGPSGSGKSSLARAGLLPAIEEGLLQTWPVHWDTLSMTPGLEPRRALHEQLAPLLAISVEASQPEVLMALGQRAERTGRGLALLIDQLEELATVSSAEEREWLAELIALSAEQTVPGFRLIITARRDLLDPLLALFPLGRVLLGNALLVEAIGTTTWEEVLDRALAAYGYRCEDEALHRELVREIELTASAMPLVGFALGRLWEMRDRTDKTITRAALRSLGGIAGALTQHAQRTFEASTNGDAEAVRTARRLLLALTTARGTRTTKAEEDLRAMAGGDTVRVLSAFEKARLLVRTPSGWTIAHEVLLEDWHLLHSWVAEEREARTLAEELEHAAAGYWTDPHAVPLWPRRRLVMLTELLSQGDVDLSEPAREFLRASQRADGRRRAMLVGSIAAVLLVAAGGAVFYLRAINAERSRTELALEGERKSRSLAEERTRDVEAAQQRIDELLRGVADSPTKDAVRELQREIREPGFSRARTSSALPAAGVLPGNPTPSPPPSAAAPTQSAKAEAPSLKVQSEW